MRRTLVVVSLAVMTSAARVAADTGAYGCHVDVGAGIEGLAEAYQETPFANVGGCELVDEVAETSRVVSTSVPEGCRIIADDDADVFADRNLEPGDYVRTGAEVGAFCDLGVFDVDLAIELVTEQHPCVDGFCDFPEEDASNCPEDCSPFFGCGDGYCDTDYDPATEDEADTCPYDCRTCGTHPDGCAVEGNWCSCQPECVEYPELCCPDVGICSAE